MVNSRNLSESDKKRVAYLQKWCCNICNELLPNTYEVDHIVPHSINSDDSLTNLQALCPNCHSKKTLREQNRIYKFKNYCRKIEVDYENICWFCLEKNENHSCSKELKDIFFSVDTKENNKELRELDEFNYIENEKDILKIVLNPEELWVNNFFTIVNQEDCDIDFICKSILFATRKSNIIYSKIEFTIDVDEEVPEELLEHLEEYLPSSLEKLETIDSVKLDISYICIEP